MALTRWILLPQSIDDKLQTLAGLKQETNGVLLYVPEINTGVFNCRVDGLYVTNVGSISHVRADSKRIAIVNRFFKNNPNYRLIKWHTHCKGTGKDWFTRFSQGDIDGYEKQLRQDSRFIGMMVSPDRYLLHGKGGLYILLIEDTAVSQQNEMQVQSELEKAASELGYDTPPLQATMPKK